MLSKGWWVRARACKQSTRSLTHVYPSKTSNLSLALMRTIMQMYRRRKAIEEYNIILKKNSNFSSPLLFYEMPNGLFAFLRLPSRQRCCCCGSQLLEATRVQNDWRCVPTLNETVTDW